MEEDAQMTVVSLEKECSINKFCTTTRLFNFKIITKAFLVYNMFNLYKP